MNDREPHTPSFEHVRDLYSWAYAWRTKDGVDDDGEDETDLSYLRASNRAEFDRAMAAHDAEVAAAAWDEGVSDGLWNAEHAHMIAEGLRTAIVNPYRVLSPGGESK